MTAGKPFARRYWKLPELARNRLARVTVTTQTGHGHWGMVLATIGEMIKSAPTAWKISTLFGLAVLAMFARPAAGAELAVLSNGFSIHHEHRVVMGTTTRL